MRLILVAGPPDGSAESLGEVLDAFGVDVATSELVTEVNERVLTHLGGTRLRPPSSEPGWHLSSSLDAERRGARALVDQLADRHGDRLVALVDPLFSILHPFWAELARPEMVVVPVAAPVRTSSLLHRAHGVGVPQASALWLRYTVDALRGAAARAIVVDRPADDLRRDLENLADALAHPISSEAATAAAASLRATEATDHDVAIAAPEAAGPAGSAAASLYDVLRSGMPSPDLLEALSLGWRAADTLAPVSPRPAELEHVVSLQQATAAVASERAELIRILSNELERAEATVADYLIERREHRAVQNRLRRVETQFAHAGEAFDEERLRARAAQLKLLLQRQAEHAELMRFQARASGLAADNQELQAAYDLLRRQPATRAWRRLRRLLGRPVPEPTPSALEPATLYAGELLESGLFQPEWYLRTHADVAEAGIDPLEHFLETGWKEGRRPNKLFDPSWYLATYPDIAEAGFNPLIHYLYYGAYEGRMPSIDFDSEWYLTTYPDVLESGSNPLGHYLRAGAAEGRSPRRSARSREPLQRVTNDFSKPESDAIIADLTTRYTADTERFDDVLVSIVMPTYNRSRSVTQAIATVVGQTHQNWQLLVVDDGSTDATADVITPLLDDPRIEFIEADHGGVSAARNLGIDHARGSLIAYLDTDNHWDPEFLRRIVVFIGSNRLDCAYAGMALLDEDEHVVGYRGERFDWEECQRSNYVDLNVFCHRAELLESTGGFDTTLRRMVDWDLILRLTRDSSVAYAPFIGCYYSDADDDSRITRREPRLFRSIVQLKNRPDRREVPSADELARNLTFSVAIRIAAPRSRPDQWGDHHYAVALASGIERLGHSCRIVYSDDADRHEGDEFVNIVLRGLTPYAPIGGAINVLWVISHPDQVSYEEFAAFDIRLCASLSLPSLVEQVIDAPVTSLLQATDHRRFRPGLGRRFDGAEADVLFVGNSRNAYRPIVHWAVDADLDLQIYGDGWDGVIAPELLGGQHIQNDALGEVYRSARLVLNDHWESMRDAGLVSNRIFDVLATGGRVVSDDVPAIGVVFGETVPVVDSADSLRHVSAATGRLPTDGDRALTDWVRERHSLDRRASEISDMVLRHVGLPPVHAVDEPESQSAPELAYRRRLTTRRRIGVVVRRGADGPQSSAFVRAICPLTTDVAWRELGIETLTKDDTIVPADYDGLIVQRTAFDDLERTTTFVDEIKAAGVPLIVDNDDAFAAIDASHPQYDDYRTWNACYTTLLEAADDAWFSTEPLAALYAAHVRSPHVVIPNALDPRIWRDYRNGADDPPPGAVPRLLYMGTFTHDADFGEALAGLDTLAERRNFELVLVGGVREVPDRPWISTLHPPRGHGRYPVFARWLRAQRPFLVGLAPLVDNAFNECKSDLKMLDYLAMGLCPVVSDVTAYQSGANNRLVVTAKNDADSWSEAIELAIAQRERIGPEAFEAQVWDERPVSHMAESMLDRLDRLR